MAAHRRRTTFAAPFVMTFATGCGHHDAAPARDAPRVWTVSMHGMTCEAVEHVAGNPPAPQPVECPPGMATGVAMSIEQQPGKAYCTSRHNVVPCPLPYGEAPRMPLSNLWLVEKDGPLCHAEDVTHCPPGADCNPPKPRLFPCPAGVTEDHPLTLAELPDATCVRVPNGCTDTGCARDKVDCLPADSK